MLPVAVQLVMSDLAIESISMDTKNRCRFCLISARFAKCNLNESFFKLAHSFIKIDSSFDHFRDKGFQRLFHHFFLELGQNVFSLFPPPALQRAITDEELCFYFIWRQYRDNSRTGQEVWR